MWEKTKSLTSTTYAIFELAAKSYGTDRVNRMAAAVAYRTMFALAPLLIIAVFFLGLAIGNDFAARAEIISTIDRLAGPTVADSVETFLRSVSQSGGTAGVVGFALLLWTGSSLFLELQNDLNDIFTVPLDQTTGLVETVRKRGLGFLWVMALGLIVVLVWLLNSVWQYLGGLLPASFAPAHRVIGLVAPVASMILLPLVFGLVFQTLTQVKVRWRAIWRGSFFTAAVFLLAAYGIGLYFRLSVDSAAGIAGALFVILFLAYLLSAVFLFGAEVTKTYDRHLARGHTKTEEPSDGFSPVIAQVQPSVPVAAVLAFLGGLFVGWRRRR
jgi:membrane protein